VIDDTFPYIPNLVPSSNRHEGSQYQRLATKFQENMWIYRYAIGGNTPCYSTQYVRLIIC
jgi:hypothetical protein